MREFGLYTIKQRYIDEFSRVDEGLSSLKNNRPFICIKVTAEKRNWLIPVASIDPSKSDYVSKNNKYRNFSELDKRQARQDGNLYARAIHIVRDLTGLQSDPNFLSVIEYYNAIPVKHKYCRKYRDSARNHIIITDANLKEAIKKALIVNIKAKKKGQHIGFIKAKINAGKEDFRNYPKKSIEIGEALYEEHIALQRAEKERIARSEQRNEELARKKELKNATKEITATAPMLTSSDNLIIANIKKCDSKRKEFEDLMAGRAVPGVKDPYGRLLNTLAFFSNCDKNAMERIFKNSKLYDGNENKLKICIKAITDTFLGSGSGGGAGSGAAKGRGNGGDNYR